MHPGARCSLIFYREDEMKSFNGILKGEANCDTFAAMLGQRIALSVEALL